MGIGSISRGITYNVHRLVVDSGLDIMLPLQEARQQLHLEALGKTVRRDPPEASPLSYILRHPLSRVLV